MPFIKLNDTLMEFFTAENRYTEKCLTYVSFVPVSDKDLTPQLRRNTKFLLPQWLNGEAPDPIVNIVLTAQRMSWIAGRLPVVFLKPDAPSVEQFNNLERALTETITILRPEYRFEPYFCSSLGEIAAFVNGGVIVPFIPSDALESLVRHHVDPEAHYKLFLKRTLAHSTLPTPVAQVIDFQLCDVQKDRKRAVAMALQIIRDRRPPFVLKLNYSASSRGTFIVLNRESQKTVVRRVHENLELELEALNHSNAHLHPCSLILTDVLPGDTVSVNFYVASNGTWKFSSCCNQDLYETGIWRSASVTYSAQHFLGLQYTEIIGKAAQFLHSRQYSGPVGIDVMTDSSGKHQIVDINPRPTASFVLGCLRSHFNTDLKMDEASVLPNLETKSSRELFNGAFHSELHSGVVVVLTWYYDMAISRSFVGLAIAAKNQISLCALRQKIEEWVRGTHGPNA